jgi:hypothetical protein
LSFCDKYVAAAFLPDSFFSLRRITILSGIVMTKKECTTSWMTKHRRRVDLSATISPDFVEAASRSITEFSSVIPYKETIGRIPGDPKTDSFSHRKIATVSPATSELRRDDDASLLKLMILFS